MNLEYPTNTMKEERLTSNSCSWQEENHSSNEENERPGDAQVEISSHKNANVRSHYHDEQQQQEEEQQPQSPPPPPPQQQQDQEAQQQQYQRRRQLLRHTSSQYRTPWLWLSLTIFGPYILLTLFMDSNISMMNSNGWLVEASQSGIYIDNGIDQTVMHRLLDEDEKIEATNDILDFLGLPDRPPHKSRHGGHLSLRKSAPQFLLDVYYRLKEEEESEDELLSKTKHRHKRDLIEEDNFITDLDKRAIDQSDIIMTFLNKHHHIEGVRHAHGRRLWFDVAEVSDDNYLMMAELRLYQNPTHGKWKETTLKLDNEQQHYQITVYVIVENEDSQELELEMLSAINTTNDYHGWLELNVTEGFSAWIQKPRLPNHGFYLTLYNIRQPSKLLKFDEIGLIHPRDHEEYQPFMIAFFRGPELLKRQKRHSRKKRSTHQRRRKKSEAVNPLMEGPPESGRSCQMKTLYINFKELGWHDWIIAPDGYGAFYCSGECNFPLNAHMNATNHAIVQTLVHLLQPKKVPKPCCAPTRLGALPVLYHLNEENVNLKKYKNMIVKSCGCH